MADDEMKRFIHDYTAAWASREPGVMGKMWHEDGVLHHPALGRPIDGRLVPYNNDNTKALIPDFAWSLRTWASSGDTVFIAWQNRGRIDDHSMQWFGVDVMTLRAGRIIEESVFFDTYPLRRVLDPSLPDTPLVDPDQLGR
jgi:ketosteroid isomerase-like protein